MFKKILDRFKKEKNVPPGQEKQILKRVTQDELDFLLSHGNMTYAKKMVADGVPVIFEKMEEGLYASLETKPFSLKEQEPDLLWNYCVLDEKIYEISYLRAVQLDHEAVHYNQHVSKTISATPETASALLNVQEAEAQMRTAYKVVDDFMNGTITEELIVEHVWDTNPFAFQYFLVCAVEELPRNPHAAVAMMKKLKEKGFQKPLPSIAAHFYYIYSGCDIEVEKNAQRALANTDAQIDFISRNKENIVDPHRLFSVNFTLEDAAALLGRDGTDYLGLLKPHTLQEFWVNMSALTYKQKERIEEQKQRLKVLGL